MSVDNNSIISLSQSMPEIWETLDEHDKEAVVLTTKILSFKKNENIYFLNTVPSQMFCLISGKVKIYKDGVGGRSQIIRIIKTGQYFGYRAFFAKEPYITEASAFEDSIICSTPIGIISEICQRNSKLANFFIKELAIDLGIADARIVNLTQKHIRGRLAESLLFLIDNYGLEEDEATIAIYLSREDLASLSNMTTSNAIRTLSTFVDEKILGLDGRKIKVRDVDALIRISNVG